MLERVTQWLMSDPDPKTREELQYLIDEKMYDELEARFDGRLKFGTAGLRGVVGCGPNRMNRLVVQQTATGLGHYLVSKVTNANKRGVIIGYDGRVDSKQFAHDCASVLTALGIKVYLTSNEIPTPVVAFGIQRLHAAAAVVITASHNPRDYNGLKVYWENGAQIIPPHDSGIAYEIDLATFKPIPLMSLDDAKKHDLLEWLDESYIDLYQSCILDQDLFHRDIEACNVTIAYSALHGVGGSLAMTMLKQAGFKGVMSVAEQHQPDGEFPCLDFPNPEEKGAMDAVIELADSIEADIACANDPDADRFAVAVQLNQGGYKKLTGDQIGVLFADYLFKKFQACRDDRAINFPTKPFVGNTVVSSTLFKKLAFNYDAEYYQTLTGFKWLANMAMQHPQYQSNFLLSYEESNGYCIGPLVRDKDGLSALVMFAQLTEQLKQNNRTIWQRLEEIYRQYDYYLTEQQSIYFSNNSIDVCEKLRAHPPTHIAGLQIIAYEDLNQSLRFITGGATEVLNLPCANVLIYYLEENTRIIIRPSGTEPKLKCYYEVIEPIHDDEIFEVKQRQAQQTMDKLINAHQLTLLALGEP
ncbi:phospho-sugar mutase [Vibrio sp. ZSDE26]|uniref:Phospho-sugar mutase n=1 Tax=Vibrio amylolyticus TaxID=2847292 RepID=A0A9X1XLQ0_9VIBR|nr:phospho-sugar mutase [Vibrio amylolyticus]MCK6264013.1 phospho-sugar mutase [Vibrio amylolyticus]